MNPNHTTDTTLTDFKNLVDLLAILSEGTARLDAMTAEVGQEYLGIVDERRKEYAELQASVSQAEAAIEALVIAHPEWFTKKKTLATAYGSVASRSTPKLEIKNEEASILLIQQTYKESPDDLKTFIRTAETLNIEALENLDDATLKGFRIKRIREEKIKITPKKVDLGKAVASAEKEAA